MLVGVAHTTINPEPGTLLGGYPTDHRRIALGVHDDLEAHAIAVRGPRSSDPDVLVAFDGIAAPAELVEQIQARLGPGPRVSVAASHTHSAPSLPIWDQDVLGPYSPAYVTALAHRLANLAARAIESESPGSLYVGSMPVDQPIGENRRRSDRHPYDQRVRVLEARDAAGDELITIVIFGCHPTILNGENQLISADLAWGLRRSLGDRQVALLLGGAGDQSTRSTRRASSFAECERFGRILADAVTASRAELRQCTSSHMVEQVVRLRGRPTPGVDEARRRLDELEHQLSQLPPDGAPVRERRRSLEVEIIGAKHDLRRASGPAHPTHFDARIVTWDLGETRIAFWPVEPTLELALTLEYELDCWLCGYANGYLGYLLPAHDHQHGGYEVAVSPFDEHATHAMLTNTAAQMVDGSS